MGNSDNNGAFTANDFICGGGECSLSDVMYDSITINADSTLKVSDVSKGSNIVNNYAKVIFTLLPSEPISQSISLLLFQSCTSSFCVDGFYNYDGGNITDITVSNDFSLYIEEFYNYKEVSESLIVNNGSLTIKDFYNSGTLEFHGIATIATITNNVNASLTLNDGIKDSTITNNGTLFLGSVSSHGWSNDTIYRNLTLQLSDGATLHLKPNGLKYSDSNVYDSEHGLFTNKIEFVDFGSPSNNDGTLTVKYNSTRTTIDCSSDSTITCLFKNVSFTAKKGNGNDTITIGGQEEGIVGHFKIIGDNNASGSMKFDGNVVIGDKGEFAIEKYAFSAKDITNNATGIISISNGSTINTTNGSITNSGTLTITNNGGTNIINTINSDITNNIGKTLIINGGGNLNIGDSTNNKNITNNGTLEISGTNTTLTINGNIITDNSATDAKINIGAGATLTVNSIGNNRPGA